MEVNLLVALWHCKDRRLTEGIYLRDSAIYLRTQLLRLTSLKHNLSQITFIAPVPLGYQAKKCREPKEYLELLGMLPEKIGQTKIEVLRPPNFQISYGSYVHAFQKYRTDFDAYIMLEDDYVFVKDNFDELLTNLMEEKKADYVCSILEGKSPIAHHIRKFDMPHAMNTNGIVRSSAFEKIHKTLGNIPYKNQVVFSWAFWDCGLNVADLRNHFGVHNWAGLVSYHGRGDDLIIPTQLLWRPQGWPCHHHGPNVWKNPHPEKAKKWDGAIFDENFYADHQKCIDQLNKTLFVT